MNGKEQRWSQPNDSKVLTDEDTQYPSTVMYSAWEGSQLCISCGSTERRNSPVCVHTLPFWRCKWTRSQIRNHLHAFILARADILEIQTQGHPKQAAAINMQIKLWMYYGLAGCQDIHTRSAQAAILNVRAEFKWWTSFNKACCILGNHKNEQNKFRNFLLNQEYFPSTASKVGNQVIQQWRFLWFVSFPPPL